MTSVVQKLKNVRIPFVYEELGKERESGAYAVVENQLLFWDNDILQLIQKMPTMVHINRKNFDRLSDAAPAFSTLLRPIMLTDTMDILDPTTRRVLNYRDEEILFDLHLMSNSALTATVLTCMIWMQIKSDWTKHSSTARSPQKL